MNRYAVVALVLLLVVLAAAALAVGTDVTAGGRWCPVNC